MLDIHNAQLLGLLKELFMLTKELLLGIHKLLFILYLS